MDTFYQFVAAVYASSSTTYSRWVAEELFSPAWLTVTAALVLCCWLTLVLIDKSRLREILLFGSLLAFIFGFGDMLATEYGLWEYKLHVIPVKAAVFPFSYTMNPLFHMFAYQYGPTWSSFAVTNTIVCAFFAFVAHPFYVWANLLWLGNWNYFFSFVVLMSVTFGLRALIIWLAHIESQHAPESGRPLYAALQPAMKPLDEEKRQEK